MVLLVPIVIVAKEGHILSNQMWRSSAPALPKITVATNLA
jgi:hypothetical protein